ncbi:MAG: hypothetical protein KKA31_03830 [Candidatus Margulisbacteria bacterium]|nr:hypothetical protein [Candidatus Margulisiibacteriota bacterium]
MTSRVNTVTVSLERAGRKFAAREVKQQLFQRGLVAKWVATLKLRRLSLPRYEAFINLFEQLADLAAGGRQVGQLKIITPVLSSLEKIDVQKLMEDKAAWQRICSDVYQPDIGILDLRALLNIHHSYLSQ